MVLRQPLNQFLEDLTNNQSRIKKEHRKELRAIIEDFYAKAMSTLKEE